MSFRAINVSAYVLLSALFSGCATTESPWVGEPLATVEMPTRVYITQAPEYRLPRFAQGTPFSTILGLMQVHGNAADAERFSEYARENVLGLQQLVLDVFGEELRSNGPFESTVESGGQGQVQLVIADYGLERGWSWTRSKPLLRLEARLFDLNGKMLWEDIADVNGFSEVADAQTLDAWLADPEMMRSAFAAAVKKASAQLVAAMHDYRG